MIKKANEFCHTVCSSSNEVDQVGDNIILIALAFTGSQPTFAEHSMTLQSLTLSITNSMHFFVGILQ